MDLYLAASLEVDGDFKAIERLQTEHGLLDDNSDGRGSEIQSGYIAPEVVESEDEGDADADEGEAAEEEADDEAVEGEDGEAEKNSPDDEPEESEGEPEETEGTESESDDDASDNSQPQFKLPPPISNRNLDGFRSRFIPVSPIRL